MPSNHLPIGDVTSTGPTSGVSITSNIAPTKSPFPAQAIQLQITASTISTVYVSSASVVVTTGVNSNVFAALHPDGFRAWSIGNPHQPNPLDAAGYFVSADTSGDGVFGSILRTGAY